MKSIPAKPPALACRPHPIGSIESSMRSLQPLADVLNRIEDPATRKIVIMSKRKRGDLSDTETEWLIRRLGLEAA